MFYMHFSTILYHFLGPTLHDHVHETDSTDTHALHKGGWRVSVSPTLVESNLTAAGPC